MKRVLLCLLICFPLFVLAQKKPLDHSVYDAWQHVGEKLVSNDGKWIAYTIDPQEGDNELVVRSADGVYNRSIPRGYTAAFSDDSRYLVFKIKPWYRETREARIKKKKADDFPKDSMGILSLANDTIWKTDKVKNYKLPAKAGGWIAYMLDKPANRPGRPTTPVKSAEARTSDSLRKVIDSLNALLQAGGKAKKKDDADGEDADGDEVSAVPAEQSNDLILRNLNNGEEIYFYRSLEYYFSKKGNRLLVEKARDPLDSQGKKSIVWYDLQSAASKTLSAGGNDFRNFTISDDGQQTAWVAERDARPKDLQKFYRVWYFKEGMDSATLLADKNAVDMKLGMTISEYGSLNFSRNGKRLFFGVAPIQPPKDTTIIEIDKPKLDVWHYKDDYLQTVQTYPARLRAAQQENFLAVYDLEKNTIRQLGSKELPQVLQTDEGDGTRFVGITDFGKRVESQWQGYTLKDIYSVDVESGIATLVKKDLLGNIYPSPAGKFILWYDRKAKNYFTWDGTLIRNITEKIKVPLYQEDWDTPELPANYGVMGWQENDAAVYLYDRYDTWKVSPLAESIPGAPATVTGKVTGPPASFINYTKNGRSIHVQYRWLRVNDEQRFIRDTDTLYLRCFNDSLKAAYVAARPAAADAGTTLVSPVPFDMRRTCNWFAKARDAARFIFTSESFVQSPDLYTNSLQQGAAPLQLSRINAQQQDFNWGTAELFRWKAYSGKMSTGLVFKPENFDPKKKYPLIVYFYEKLSDGLHTYREPAPIRSAVNVSFFVSRGYIIFMPDIEYKTGYPGQSAYDYIVSGTRALVKSGWIDSTNMALQGHSWGGYQAAQVATMTKLYKAVWAGAPVANMTSAYGGIRWESGVNRQ